MDRLRPLDHLGRGVHALPLSLLSPRLTLLSISLSGPFRFSAVGGRKLLRTGAAAAALAATPSSLRGQRGDDDGGRFYERGNVRIRYEETGSGFPLLLISGGG